MSLLLQRDVSLKPYNTMGIDARAQLFAEASGEPHVREALTLAARGGYPLQVIGGGSNVLLTQDVDGLVLRMNGRGIEIVQRTDDYAIVEAQAGEPWHPFVQWTLQQGLAGLENLSLIPGTVGAAPMQNVGAYGVEIKDAFESLSALDRQTGEVREFNSTQCAFAYRDSVFKRQAGRWVILRVRFRLQYRAPLHLDYGPVRQRLADMGITEPTAQQVSQIICAIRSEKLPDPQVLGNSGSFFKNPVIGSEHAQRLRAMHADLVSYPAPDGQVKLAAGWLIERAGWKAHRQGDAGVHQQQALVLVNYGGASGAQMLALAQRIQADIYQRFAVELEIEPSVL